MLKEYLKGKVLVVIDAANLESAVKSLGWWIDYIKLRELFDKDKLIEIRNYCVQHNTDNQNSFFTFLKNNARLFQRAVDNRKDYSNLHFNNIGQKNISQY